MPKEYEDSWLTKKSSPAEKDAKRKTTLYKKYSGTQRQGFLDLMRKYPNLTSTREGYANIASDGHITERITFSVDGLELESLTYRGTTLPRPTEHDRILHHATYEYDSDGCMIKETDTGLGALPHIAWFYHTTLPDGEKVLEKRVLQEYNRQGFIEFGPPLNMRHEDTFYEFHGFRVS